MPPERASLRQSRIRSGTRFDEVGHVPVEQDVASLFFQLVSSRSERALLLLTSNLPFARWGDGFGDQVGASAMIDRIVHHAVVFTPSVPICRLKQNHVDSLPSARPEITAE